MTDGSSNTFFWLAIFLCFWIAILPATTTNDDSDEFKFNGPKVELTDFRTNSKGELVYNQTYTSERRRYIDIPFSPLPWNRVMEWKGVPYVWEG